MMLGIMGMFWKQLNNWRKFQQSLYPVAHMGNKSVPIVDELTVYTSTCANIESLPNVL